MCSLWITTFILLRSIFSVRCTVCSCSLQPRAEIATSSIFFTDAAACSWEIYIIYKTASEIWNCSSADVIVGQLCSCWRACWVMWPPLAFPFSTAQKAHMLARDAAGGCLWHLVFCTYINRFFFLLLLPLLSGIRLRLAAAMWVRDAFSMLCKNSCSCSSVAVLSWTCCTLTPWAVLLSSFSLSWAVLPASEKEHNPIEIILM